MPQSIRPSSVCAAEAASAPSAPSAVPAGRRGRVLVVVLVAVALFAIGGSVLWWWTSIGRWPLAGPQAHDFGVVTIKGDDILLTHRFELVNRRSEPLMIRAIRPSCGCAGAEASLEVVPPGETVFVDGRLSLEAAGQRRASLTILFEGGETQQLLMNAVGRKDRVLRLEPPSLTLRGDGTSQVLVQAQIQPNGDGAPSDTPPAAPTIVAPPGLAAEWMGWTKMADADPAHATADRWRGQIRITVTNASAVEPGRAMAVSIPDTDPDAPVIRAICRINGLSLSGAGGSSAGPGFGGGGEPRPLPIVPPDPEPEPEPEPEPGDSPSDPSKDDAPPGA